MTNTKLLDLIPKMNLVKVFSYPRKALEEWRDHYRNVAEKHPDEREFPKLYYVGMADVLTDILKYFEEE